MPANTIATSAPVAIADEQMTALTSASASGGASRGPATDRSGTTAGTSSQQVMAANTSRKYLIVINVSASPLWINFGTAAVMDSPSIPLAANGGSFVMESSFVFTDAINIIGGSAALKYTAKEG